MIDPDAWRFPISDEADLDPDDPDEWRDVVEDQRQGGYK